MRRVLNSVVWAGLALALPGVLMTFGSSRDPSALGSAVAPGHGAEGCRPCRDGEALRGRPLPFEIDDSNVHSAVASSSSSPIDSRSNPDD